jgi:hypothetical protein
MIKDAEFTKCFDGINDCNSIKNKSDLIRIGYRLFSGNFFYIAYGENSFNGIGRNYYFYDLQKIYEKFSDYITEYCKIQVVMFRLGSFQ